MASPHANQSKHKLHGEDKLLEFTTCEPIEAQAPSRRQVARVHHMRTNRSTSSIKKTSCSSSPHANQSKHKLNAQTLKHTTTQPTRLPSRKPEVQSASGTSGWRLEARSTSTTKGMKPSRTTIARQSPRLHRGTPAPEDLGDDHASARTRTVFCPNRRSRSSSLLTSNSSNWENSHDAREHPSFGKKSQSELLERY